MSPTRHSRSIETPMEPQTIGSGATTIMTVPERNWKRQCRRGNIPLDNIQTDVYDDACLYSRVAWLTCLLPQRLPPVVTDSGKESVKPRGSWRPSGGQPHESINRKQRRVYEYIQDYFIRQGLPPSVREVAQALGKSAQAIQQHIEVLRVKGYLDHQPSKSRANVPLAGVSENERVVDLPLLGRIQAGLPILAEENREGTIPLPREWVGDTTVFLLKVEGDSMIDAHILPADMVLVRKQPTAENGEIVVARVNGDEATLKRFYQLDGKIRLKPENSRYQVIELGADEVEIVGKVIGVFRRF